MEKSKTKLYEDPQELTPNQVKWKDRYLKLSGDPDDTFDEVLEEYHEVFEWEDGWCDYTVEGDVLWIWTLYSHRDDDKDGLSEGKGGDAMNIAVRIAKAYKCKYIDFDTHRDTGLWISGTKKHGKIEVISRQLRVVLNEEEKKNKIK